MKNFTEKQRFSQWWLWVVLLPVTVLPFYGIYQQLIVGKPFGNNPMSDTGLIIFAIAMSAFTGIIYLMRLSMNINERGIFVRFFPLFSRKVNWEDIGSLEIVKYGFVGGYGIRLTQKFGTVYNMNGKWGLLIVLKGGSKFCVGTRNKEALEKVIREAPLK